MAEIDLSRLNDELFDALVHNQSVQAVISRAYACIGLPIIAIDVSFKLLGYAFPRPFSFMYWEQIAAEGQAADVIDALGSLNYHEMMYSNRKSTVFNWGPAKNYPQVDSPIMQGDSLVGYVGIGIENQQDIDTLLEASDLLADALAISLRDSARDADAADAQRRAAENLLVLEQVPGDVKAQITAAYPPPYVFAVLASKGPKISTMQYVRSILCSQENAALGALNKNRYLYILFYQVGKSVDLAYIKTLLQEIAQKYSFSGGVSDFFSDAADIPVHRMQSMLAMTVGQELADGQSIFLFREYYGDIVCYSAMKSIGPAVCTLPAVDKLAGSDAADGTEYLATLRAYLSAFQDRAAAAKALGIHKNTVLYRIHRIEEILGMDLSDPACAGKLELGLKFCALSHCGKQERTV